MAVAWRLRFRLWFGLWFGLLLDQPVQWTLGGGDQWRTDLRIAGGGVNLAMAKQDLDHAHVGAVFQQVSGEAMAQSMRRDALADAGALAGFPASQTEGGAAEMAVLFPGRKEPDVFWTGGSEIGSQQSEQAWAEHGVTVLAALALLDADEHAGAVDIGDL